MATTMLSQGVCYLVTLTAIVFAINGASVNPTNMDDPEMKGTHDLAINETNYDNLTNLTDFSPLLTVNGKNLTEESVIPPPIDLSSVTLTGRWNNFTLFWKATPVEHGQVFYEILFSYSGTEVTMVSGAFLSQKMSFIH